VLRGEGGQRLEECVAEPAGDPLGVRAVVILDRWLQYAGSTIR
jgi:hypothetical protein